jgi:hypothetical protein
MAMIFQLFVKTPAGHGWSKANSYPMYTSAVSAKDAVNVEEQKVFWVSDLLQHSLRKLFVIEG